MEGYADPVVIKQRDFSSENRKKSLIRAFYKFLYSVNVGQLAPFGIIERNARSAYVAISIINENHRLIASLRCYRSVGLDFSWLVTERTFALAWIRQSANLSLIVSFCIWS
jgi:hypothetical protein